MNEIVQDPDPAKGKKDDVVDDQVQTNIMSGWKTLQVYKAALLWSGFMGLAGINWGMDVMVGYHPL